MTGSHDESVRSHEVVRPFVMTGGRTRAQRRDLRLETMLSAVPGAEVEGLGREERRLLEACATPQSVAEASAELGLVVGVTIILAADLVVGGQMELHQTDPVEIELDVLSRMIERVRAL
ncbi:DUF742 domain-containing protein [Actinospongicola halichondriae]|uniref:DUF742 domain-containing protein n=1 Tax=Actinospongicola halichondriae TaxID=3236844 RepID=UPI003D376F6F